MKKIIVLVIMLCCFPALAQRPQVGTATVGSPVAPFGSATFNLNAFSFTTIGFSNIASGNLDIVTVPAGYRGTYQNAILGGSTNSSTITYFTQVKTNGNYFRLTSNATLPTSTASVISGTLVFEAGDTFAINYSATGSNLYVQWVQWPTNIAIFSPRVYNPGAGDNTVYIVPTGKTAFPFSFANIAGNTFNANYVNASGGARTAAWYIVPSGGSVGQFTLIRSASVADITLSSQSWSALGSETSVVLNLDAGTATQIVWATIIEL